MQKDHVIDWKDANLERQIKYICGKDGEIRLSDLEGIDEMELGTADEISDPSALSELVWLKKLFIEVKPNTSIAFLENLVDLKELSVVSYRELDFAPLKGLKKLKTLLLAGDLMVDICPQNIAALGELTSLEELKLMDIQDVDLSFLEKLHGLKKLELIELGAMSHTRSITASPKLRELTLFELILSDVDFLCRLDHRLQYLDITSNVIFDASSLSALPKITSGQYEIASNEIGGLEFLRPFSNQPNVTGNSEIEEKTFNWYMKGPQKDYWNLKNQK